VVDLIDQYYRSTSQAEARQLQRGQLCWAPGFYLPEFMDVLALEYYDPRDERNNRYRLSREPQTLFEHTPVHELHLTSDEELIVVKGKRRLFMVASQAPGDWRHGGARLRERGYVCLPLYSFHDEDTPELRARVKALEYPWWIYLPEDVNLRMREGFIRLDRLQVISQRLLNPMIVTLTEDVVLLISEWLRYYLTEEIDPFFLEYRQELLKGLP